MRLSRRAAMQMMMSASAAGVMYGQMGQKPVPPGAVPPPIDPLGKTHDMEDDPAFAKMQEQQAKARNNDRQKRLEADTDKLLALATELKQDVGKTDKNILSVDVIKKADEIEKLAKSVKDRMRG